MRLFLTNIRLCFFIIIGINTCLSTSSAQTNWKAKDVLYVVYPNGCYLYEKPDTNSPKISILIRTTRLELLQAKKMSKEMVIDGIQGRFRFVKWLDYKGYVFDGFVTNLYVCKLETCSTIMDALDNMIVRAYSYETEFECPQDTASKPLDFDPLALKPSCDTIHIQWTNGGEFWARQEPKKIVQTYILPNTNVQEVFLWLKLFDDKYAKCSLRDKLTEHEEFEEWYKYMYSYDYDFGENKRIQHFKFRYKEINTNTKKLFYEQRVTITPYLRNNVYLIIEKYKY